jgi:hypothetical protein
VSIASTKFDHDAENHEHPQDAKQEPSGLGVADGEQVSIEKPKRFSTRRYRGALWSFLIIHLPPVFTTGSFFVLYCQTYYWYPDPQQLNFILFAAKVHESWILVSLSSILFDHFRRQLICKGVQLGLLTAPFQIANPLYLFSRSFFGAVSPSFTPSLSIRFNADVLNVFLVIYISILSVLCGPSSGIVMLPKLDWFRISHGGRQAVQAQNILGRMEQNGQYANLSTLGRIDMFLTEDQLHPNIVNASTAPSICFGDSSVDGFKICPNGGAKAILDRLNTLFISSNQAYRSYVYNLTVTSEDCKYTYTEPKYNYAKELHGGISISSTSSQNALAYAVSPIDMVVEYLTSAGRDWEGVTDYPVIIKPSSSLTGHEKDSLKVPLVWASCSNNSDTPPDSRDPYTFQFYNPSRGRYEIKLERDLFSDPIQPLKPLGSSVLNRLPIPVSAAFASASSHGSPASLCLVFAYWANADVWLSLPSKMPTLGASEVSRVLEQNGLSENTDIIQLNQTWLGLLKESLNGNFSGYNQSSSATSGVYQACETVNGLGSPWLCRTSALALILADALARLHYRHPSYYQCENGPAWILCDRSTRKFASLTPLMDEGWLTIRPEYHHYVYAYKSRGATTLLAFTVLFFHVATVMIYIAINLGRNWRPTRAWSELGELVVLALNSAPTELLKNTGIGVRNLKSWKYRATVKAVEPDGCLQLFLEGPGECTAEDEECQKQVRSSRPQPDIKYG